jgi:hypothetical protein
MYKNSHNVMILRDMISVYTINSGFGAIMSQNSKSFWAIPKACGTRPDNYSATLYGACSEIRRAQNLRVSDEAWARVLTR